MSHVTIFREAYITKKISSVFPLAKSPVARTIKVAVQRTVRVFDTFFLLDYSWKTVGIANMHPHSKQLV